MKCFECKEEAQVKTFYKDNMYETTEIFMCRKCYESEQADGGK